MSYTIFMVLAFASAWFVSRWMPKKLPLPPAQSFFIGLTGFVGAVMMAKLPFMILSDDLLHNAGTILFSGKTILMGLVGGYLGVEFGKYYLGVKTKTGDYFAVPVAVGVGVGRLGCFFGGCCFGVPTSLPWGIVFPTADALARHPVQIYESLFHLSMAGLLAWMSHKQMFRGQLIKLYFLSYFTFRFLTEFIRPEIDWVFGLSAYQWAIVCLVPVFLLLWMVDRNSLSKHVGK